MKRNRLSPLEIVLSGCLESRSAVYGSGIPEHLTPEVHSGAGELDIAILAPDAVQRAESGWLNAAINDICRRASDDTVVYVIAPLPSRFRIAKALHVKGFKFQRALVHLPSLTDSRLILPVSGGCVAYLLETAAGPGRRASFLSGLAGPLISKLWRCALVLPSAGLLFGLHNRPKSPEVALVPGRCKSGEIMAASCTSWKSSQGPVTIQLFESSSQPLCVGKIRLRGVDSDRTLREAECLRKLPSSAQKPGIAIPHLLDVGGTRDFPIMYVSRLPGYSAARVLRRNAGKLPVILQGLADWLCEWNKQTAIQGTLTPERFRQDILNRAECLSGKISAAGYVAWLKATFTKAVDNEMTLADAHNDLTMRNVLVGGDGGLGILDWEEHSQSVLPFTDLFYAAADAVAATSSYRNRVVAMQETFVPAGRHAALVRSLVMKTAQDLKTPPLAVALAFHACWLHHAWNEYSSGTREQPFLEILRWVVSTRDTTFGHLQFS